MANVERPIFVTGMGRSGTTLLQSLLSAHSRMGIAPESHFVKNALLFGGLEEDRPRDFDAFWERYTSNVNFRDLGIDSTECLEVMEESGDRSYGGIFDAMLRVWARKVDKPRVGEKTPNHVRFLDHLLAWFPDAKVLVMRRDPRAVVASQLRSPWVTLRLQPRTPRGGIFIRKRSLHLARFAREWVRTYRDLVPAREKDSRVMVVAYERLVRDTEAQLQAVCDFLGEAFEAGMLTSRSEETVPPPDAKLADERYEAWRQEHVSKALGPVDETKVEKWKRHLGPGEVAGVESWCRRTMEDVGYASASSLPGRLVAGAGYRGVLAGAGLEEGARSVVRRAIRGKARG
jgi:hypothetical protein